jgi:hypothetical protein
MAAPAIIGVVGLGLLVTAAFRSEATNATWLLGGAFVVGNLVLVLSHGVVLGTLGALLLLGSLSALVAVRVRSRRR